MSYSYRLYLCVAQNTFRDVFGLVFFYRSFYTFPEGIWSLPPFLDHFSKGKRQGTNDRLTLLLFLGRTHELVRHFPAPRLPAAAPWNHHFFLVKSQIQDASIPVLNDSIPFHNHISDIVRNFDVSIPLYPIHPSFPTLSHDPHYWIGYTRYIHLYSP